MSQLHTNIQQILLKCLGLVIWPLNQVDQLEQRKKASIKENLKVMAIK